MKTALAKKKSGEKNINSQRKQGNMYKMYSSRINMYTDADPFLNTHTQTQWDTQ